MSETKRLIAITGVSKGLGRAMVEEFVRKGHRIAGCARSASAIHELTSSFPQHRFDVVDVANFDQVQAWANDIVATCGTPDLVINNAALINSDACLWEIAADEFASLTATNVNGTAFVCKAFLPAMMQAGVGVIANFSSGWGRSTSPKVAPYCASKWAVEGMTRALSQELPRGLAAVAVNPGIINTEMLQSCFGAGAASYPSACEWAGTAVPFLLQLGANDNGRSVNCP
ncbi:MAG: SDR family oxidoreductase [Pirellulaceae bacterium]